MKNKLRQLKFKLIRLFNRIDPRPKYLIIKQVNPQNQMWQWELCDYEDVSIFGNRDYKGYKTYLLKRILDFMDGQWEEDMHYTDYVYYLNDNKPLNIRQLSFILSAMRKYCKGLSHYGTRYYARDNDHDCIVAIANALTSREWEIQQISGYSQGDWQYCMYPLDMYKDAKDIEDAYFSLGTEWMIGDVTRKEILCSDFSCDFVDYQPSYMDDDEFMKYVSEQTGVKVENITVYEYDGEIRKTKYKRRVA